MCTYTCRSDLPGSTSHCIDKNRNPLAISEKTDIVVEIGRGGPPNVQNTQINRSGVCGYVNVCPMEGKLAVGKAGALWVSRSYYVILASCI